MNKKKRCSFYLLGVLFTFIVLSIIAFICVWNGWILLNNPSEKAYPVRGVDVSSYQGEIDWQVLSKQNAISFAFIKATEGSTFVDQRFQYNYTEAQKTNLRIRAYHFFSFDSAGKTQAENFIKNVAKTENMLPPVIDLEFYGDKAYHPPKPEAVHTELNEMLDMLEAYYGVKPIIYVTKEAYSLYIKGHYEAYAIWYRNVISTAKLPDGRAWTFWQYTNREKLDGYHGTEKFIDMNVFYGTKTEFEQYGLE